MLSSVLATGLFVIASMASSVAGTVLVASAIFIVLAIALVVKWYKKPVHGRALVLTGAGGTKVRFDRGVFVIPVLHRLEIMDITLKTVTITRTGVDGLICKDNMRADIKVTFFVKVNRTMEDVKQVAFSIGCERASQSETLENLFDAKFSEALKTAGKRFDFVDLYTSRNEFKQEMLDVIGRDLSGYVLDDAAIDYLEQTSVDLLKKDNILDSEGIKKITELTANQQILANQIQREKEKTIRKQDVEAQETILELNRQLAEKTEKQAREVANIKDREQAETKKVAQEQLMISEQARIHSEESIQIAEENKQRQVIVAMRNKERVDAVELERVEQDKQLQINERERIVTLAQIEKEKAVEEEKRSIQDIIRERVTVEKSVVIEEEKIKDTKAFAEADRSKKVAITNAEQIAEQGLVRQIKNAEAAKEAATFEADKRLIEAQAAQDSAIKEGEAKKVLAEAKAAEEAAIGISEAQVIEAKAHASKVQGETEADVIRMKAQAEADGLKQKGMSEADVIKEKGTSEAEITQQQGTSEAEVIRQKGNAAAEVISSTAGAEKEKGLAEASVLHEKLRAEAMGIEEKAAAMKKLDGVGKEHEEFKLQLGKEKDVELAQINIQKDIAAAQASVIAEALKAANIDIVGGETMFFDQIIGAITKGKTVDRLVENSEVLETVKDEFFNNPDGLSFKDSIRSFVGKFGLNTEDVKNLSISALILKLTDQAKSKTDKNLLETLMDLVIKNKVGNKNVSDFI